MSTADTKQLTVPEIHTHAIHSGEEPATEHLVWRHPSVERFLRQFGNRSGITIIKFRAHRASTQMGELQAHCPFFWQTRT